MACVLCVAGASCVSKPTMRLNHAEISGVRVNAFPPTAGLLMTVVVDVHNSNSYDVAVRGMRGEVVMAGKYHLPIDFRPGGDGVWMAAGTTTSVRVPVTVPLQVAIALLGESAASTTVPYHVKGRADVTASRTFQLERDDYAVDEEGSISRQQIAAVIPNSL
jgi:hypothetical protein